MWKTLGRPGHSGREQQERKNYWNGLYSKDNWRIRWFQNGEFVQPWKAYQLYEEGYYQDSLRLSNQNTWKHLLSVARDVGQGDDVKSSLQDAAFREAVARRGWKFEGELLVRIRKHEDYWGAMFSSGRVPCYGDIVQPELESWWEPGSIESQYQSGKFLQVKEDVRRANDKYLLDRLKPR